MDDKFLSQDEVDALLQDVDGEGEEAKVAGGAEANPEAAQSAEGDVSNEPQPYDLATQERIVRSRMPTFDVINERFARLMRDELYSLLRRTVGVNIGPVRTLKYSEFIDGLTVPTNFNLINAHPLRGTGLMVFDPTLVFLVIDSMFGGDGRFHTRIKGREFTPTEERIIKRVLDIVFKTYQEAWASTYPLNFEYLRSEMNPQFVNIATQNEVVVLTTVSIEVGDHTAEMYFCLPYAMVEPLRDILCSDLPNEIVASDKNWTNMMTQQVKSAEVTIVADIGSTDISLGEVMKLKVGDVVPLEINETVEGKVDNVPVMECKYGVFNGKYALRVEKLLKSNSSEYVKGEPDGE